MSELEFNFHDTIKDPFFMHLNGMVEERRVRTWSTLEERALLFHLARAESVSTIVEIGSFCGGSVTFLAGGAKLRKREKCVFCIDTFLGAPVWFPRGWMHSTFDEFTQNIAALSLSGQVVSMRGESGAVAAVWPARPIDILFIDGDHSFLGVISDFEKWATKVSDGGFILIDDIDHISDVAMFSGILSSISGLTTFGNVGGIAVFRKDTSGFDMLDDLRLQLAKHNVVRPWNYGGLEAAPTPTLFKKHATLSTELNLCYELAFFSIAEKGDYGVTEGISDNMKAVVRNVAADKGDGVFVTLPTAEARCLRACFCTIDDIASAAAHFQPGTVVLMETKNLAGTADAARKLYASLDIEAFDHAPGGNFFWGVFRPFSLSPDTIIASHYRNAGLR